MMTAGRLSVLASSYARKPLSVVSPCLYSTVSVLIAADAIVAPVASRSRAAVVVAKIRFIACSSERFACRASEHSVRAARAVGTSDMIPRLIMASTTSLNVSNGLDGLRALAPGGVLSVGNFDGLHLGHRKII